MQLENKIKNVRKKFSEKILDINTGDGVMEFLSFF